ncbi:DUF4832 domain-containing protein [Paenarthrobacter nicotinovorans]|uniref:DUF4832 domain-containing protein n=1 Tax=Paenarthrobacter nicotinovorans TaxID=29320 RepID=UPI0037FDB75A
MRRRAKASLAGQLAAAIALATLVASPTAAQAADDSQVTVHPAEYGGAIKNPLMGMSGKDFFVNTTDPASPEDQPLDYMPWGSTMMTYIPWGHLEDNAADSIDKIKAYLDQRWRGKDSNGQWQAYEDYGIKVIPRLYLRFPTETSGNAGSFYGLGGDHWPADLSAGDFTSPAFDARLQRMIQRLAQLWDNDPRVAYVQMGIFGTWGEQHGTAQPANIETYFNQYFQNKHVQVRYVDKGQWADPTQFGHYNDSIGDRNTAGNWATEPIGGEPSYDYTGQTLHGANTRETYLDEDYRNNTTNLIRSTHSTYLTWVGDYSYGSRWTDFDKTGSREAYLANKAAIDTGAESVQKELGYRYVMSEFSYPKQINPGGQFNVSFKVKNTGSAPMYYNWPVQVSLRDPDTNQIVWSDNFKKVDIRKWQPGSGYTAYNNKKDGSWSNSILNYTTPPKENSETGSFTLPENLPSKDYLVQLAVLDPGGNVPSLRFAMQNYTEGGYHPMGYVGVGRAPTTTTVDPAKFDNPAVDVSLRYFTGAQTPSTEPRTLASIKLTSAAPALLAQHGDAYDLKNLLAQATDSDGNPHGFDAAPLTWSITSGGEHATLTGSILTPGTAGTVQVTGSYNGVTSNAFTFEISDNVGNLSGKITTDGGAAVPGASVKVASAGHSYTTTTDVNGDYTINDALAGHYNVTAIKADYIDATAQDTIIGKAQTTTVNLLLRLNTGGNFTDDFSAGAGKWTPGTGSWAVTNGTYNQSTIGGSNSWRYQSTITGKIWKDATYDVDMSYGGAGTSWGAFLFRKPSQAATINTGGYFVDWQYGGKLELGRGAATIKVLATAQRTTDWTQPHHLKIVTKGSNIKVYLDYESTPVFDIDDTTFSYGYAAVGAAGAKWNFDNVTVTEEPILTSLEAPAPLLAVKNGTAKTAAGLGLPATVTLKTTTGTADAAVAWDVATSSYDPANPASQDFTVSGNATLPAGIANPNAVSLATSVNVHVDARPINVAVTTASKCVASNTMLTATVVNSDSIPVAITLKYGSKIKVFDAVDPGKSVFHPFVTQGGIPAGVLTVLRTATVNGRTLTSEQTVTYPARQC